MTKTDQASELLYLINKTMQGDIRWRAKDFPASNGAGLIKKFPGLDYQNGYSSEDITNAIEHIKSKVDMSTPLTEE